MREGEVNDASDFWKKNKKIFLFCYWYSSKISFSEYEQNEPYISLLQQEDSCQCCGYDTTIERVSNKGFMVNHRPD